MEYSIRLADRQGLLQGTDINIVQRTAIEILMMLDGTAEADKYLTSIKLALIAANERNISLIAGGDTDDTDDITEEDLEDTEGSWKFTNADNLGMEDVERLLAQAESGELVLSSAELAAGDDDWI